MNSTSTRIVAGFLAGILAVLIFHQGMYVIIQQFGKPYGLSLGGSPWNLNSVPIWSEMFNLLKTTPIKVPTIVRQSIWGGLYGVLFAYLIDRIPGGLSVIKGFVFGFIFPTLVVGWLLLPYIKGEPLMSNAFAGGGFDYLRLRTGFLLNTVAFGIGLGLLYPFIAGLFSRRN